MMPTTSMTKTTSQMFSAHSKRNHNIMLLLEYYILLIVQKQKAIAKIMMYRWRCVGFIHHLLFYFIFIFVFVSSCSWYDFCSLSIAWFVRRKPSEMYGNPEMLKHHSHGLTNHFNLKMDEYCRVVANFVAAKLEWESIYGRNKGQKVDKLHEWHHARHACRIFSFISLPFSVPVPHVKYFPPHSALVILLSADTFAASHPVL